MTSAERVAKNDATFREANEKIEAKAQELGIETVPFICECAEMACSEIVRLTFAEYEAIRADSTLFLNAPGHDVAAGPHGRVVSRHEGYVVVQKIGEAGEIVKELDERTTSGG
jgi:hypothetical protein